MPKRSVPLVEAGSRLRCWTCRAEKPASEYYFDRARDGLYPYCKSCQRAKTLKRYYAAKERDPLFTRRASLRRRYRITLEEYDAILAKQAGLCAVCRQGPERSSHGVLAVDHDHVTGVVRGLLCTRCNGVLSRVAENEQLLVDLALYLEAARV